MKTLVVGDLHGRFHIAERALNSGYFVLFMGDYLDSFHHDRGEQTRLLQLVMQAVRDGNALALAGNHEMSYLDAHHRCSGWSMEMQAKIDQFLWADMKEYLKAYIWHEKFLFSHAGVSQWLLQGLGISLEEYLRAGNFDQIGHRRGGYDDIGGLYWCDWFMEFSPLEDVPQVVGHSGYRPRGEYEGILQDGNSYNVDCYEFKEEFLLVEDGKVDFVYL